MTDAEATHVYQALEALSRWNEGQDASGVQHSLEHLRMALQLAWLPDTRRALIMAQPCALGIPTVCRGCGELLWDPRQEGDLCVSCIVNKFPAYREPSHDDA